MGSKKKRKSANPAEEHPTKRPSSQQGRRPGSGSGSEGPLAWTAEGVAVSLSPGQVSFCKNCFVGPIHSHQLLQSVHRMLTSFMQATPPCCRLCCLLGEPVWRYSLARWLQLEP
jgi:hypothetical protein